MLEQTGFSVLEAVNGQEAVKLFKSWHPHFIWMDIRMPVMDGLEATRTIRELPGGKHLPIVALTASAFEEEHAEIVAAGRNMVLAKLLEENKLFAIMAELLPVSFTYINPGNSPQDSTKTESTAADLSTLSAALRSEILNAAEALDLDAMRDLIQQIRQTDTAVAGTLEALLKDYHFDCIASLCRKSR